MSSLKLDKLIRRLTDVVDRRVKQAGTQNYHQGYVVSSDPSTKIAKILVGTVDRGVEVEVHEQSGFLPAVGSKVMLSMNGAEPMAFAPQHMVDGDMQSKEFVADLSGWMINAEGDAEFNSVKVRGEIVGSSFTTRSLDNGRRIAILPSDDPGTADQIIFSTGEATESQPATLGAEVTGVGDPTQYLEFSLLGMQWAGLSVPRTRPAIRLLSNNASFAPANDEGVSIDGFVIRLTADSAILLGDISGSGGGTVYTNGLKISQPPMLHDRRTSNQSIANNTWTTTAGRTNVRNNAAGSSGHTAYNISSTDARCTPGRVGQWRLWVRANWALSSAGALRQMRLVNDNTMTARVIDVKPPTGGLVMHNVTDYIEVTNATHVYSLGVLQDSGGALNLSECEWVWEWVSD